MGQNTYASTAGRINEVKGEMIAHAIPFEVLALGCTMKQMPKNQGDNITFRRRLPYGATTTNANTINRWSVTAAAHVVSEGVTPPAETIAYQDVPITLQQYGCLYSYDDKAADLHEDNIPEDQKIECGERMGLVREMIRYGAMKACTNVHYMGGTSCATVDEKISLTKLRHVAKGLLANHAAMKNKVISASPDYNTSPIEAGFLVFVHTDCEPDIRSLTGFTPVAEYSNKPSINENEIGSCERFRFIGSPELNPYLAAGAAVGSTGMTAADSTNLDVYPMIIVGADGAFDIALRGTKAMDITHIPHTQKDKSDPLGQRGYVGALFYSAALVANNGWMAVIEVATTDTSA